MNKVFARIGFLVSAVMLLAACGAPAAAPTATAAPAAAAPAAGAAMPTTDAKVMVAKTSLGQVLVDDKGMTLYMYTKDTDGSSVCYDKCATSWPPLLTKAKATAGDGADASLLGTTKRTDGSLQVTYKKMPLYYFAKDKAVGDVTGQDVGKVWYVVAANGDIIK